ncbi:helix-turn-helix domain-containing protein [Pseudacidovorax intermedius]|uniref:helix-turn-helix domain-containing protein n=1 Tax=Pseudacidovorax intermedius TaxID=433924 RepID=UPI0026EFD17A|nr:helix-turn-helix transcriptional regulator [Pseudacidovorax intermedius]
MAVRREAGVSQASLAEKLTRPQSFVSKYETGRSRLDVADFVMVCDGIGVTAWEVMRRIEEARAGSLHSAWSSPDS